MSTTAQSVLRLQLRVIFALVLREASARYGRTRLGYFWALAEPIAYILVSTALFSFFGRRPPVGESILVYFVVGFIPFLMFRGLATRLTRTIDSADGLLTFPVIKPPDIIFAKIILEVMTMATVAIIIFSAIAFFYKTTLPQDPLALIGAIGTTVMLGAGIGSINAVILIFVNSWDRIFPVFFRLAYAFSGIYTVTDRLPEYLRNIIVWSPINHCIEWVRVAFFEGYTCYSLDRAYPALLGLALLVVGLSAERALRRRILST